MNEVAVAALGVQPTCRLTGVMVDVSVAFRQETVRRRLTWGMNEVAVGILGALAPFSLTWVLVDASVALRQERV